MTKTRWRDSIRSLGNHIDPQKDEQLKKTKIEIDDQVAKIVKLIKNKNQGKKDGNLTKESELVELIDDFHKKYQALYALYDTLRGEVKEKVQVFENKESFSSSSSDSESYHSVDEASARSSPRHDQLQKVRDEFKQKLETSSSEFADRRNKLNSMSEEKEALNSKLMASLSKIQESEKIISELRHEVEQKENTKQKLMNEYTHLKEKLVEREKELLSHTRAHQVHESTVPTQIKGLEREVSSLKLERKNLCTQKRELEEQTQARAMEAKQLGEENSGLRTRILNLELTMKEKEDAISALQGKLEKTESNSKSEIEDTLRSQKSELEEQVDSKIERIEEENSELRTLIIELEMTSKEKGDTISALLRKVEENESNSGYKTEELISCANSLQLEVDNLRTQNSKLEEQVALKSKQLEEENLGLQARILELEKTSKEKEDTLSSLQRKLEENECDSKSKIEGLMARANSLELEVDTLRTMKSKLEEQAVFKSSETSAQVKGFMDQVNVLQKELHSLSSQKTESESTLEKLTQEVSDFLIQIQSLKEKLENKTVDLERMIEEKKGLERRVKDLELEAGSQYIQKSELEEQMRSKNHEADQLKVEREGLQVQISHLEKSVKERGDEFSSLQTMFEGLENDSSTRIKALGEELKKLQQKLDSLQTEKSQMEVQIEREKQVSLENLTRIEKEKIELTSKIEEHQYTLKGQEEDINKLNEEHKQLRARHLESKLNHQIAEKKIEETAEEFCKKLEDSLRILSRRIRVAEQLHVENKDICRRTKEMYEQENMELKERVATIEGAVMKMKEISLMANETLFGLDAVALKFEQCGGNFLNRISKSSCEVLFAKDWVRRKNKAIKHVQEDVDCLLAQLDAKEAEVLGLREKVWKLENKVRELEKMVKEKEEGMLGMGEEKREAIRQLCVWIDYHRSRSDYLKKILYEMTAVRSQRTS